MCRLLVRGGLKASLVARPERPRIRCQGIFMLERLRAAVPAVALAGASLILLTPAAHAASSPTPAIYTDSDTINTNQGPGGFVWTYDGSTTGSTIVDQATVWDAATSPDGRTAYVIANVSGQLTLIPRDVASGSFGAPIASFAAPDTLSRIALSPDGATAYVSAGDHIRRITLSSGAVSAAFDPGAAVRAVAVSPDGRFVYASSGNDLVKLNASTGAVLDRVSLGQAAGAVKVSADGRTAYVIGDTASQAGGAKLFKVTLSTMTIADSAALPGDNAGSGLLTGFGLALSPDQSLVYVSYTASDPADRAAVVPVRTSDLHVGTPIVILDNDHVNGRKLDLAFTPDGRTVYGYLDERSSTKPVFTIDVSTNTVRSTTPTTDHDHPFNHQASMSSVVVPADQGPHARFAATSQCAGKATSFNASAWTVAQGSIVRYAWNFGDGVTKVTTGPKVSHVYKKAGSYAASVTETDSAGTSTTVVFDGQTILRNGSAAARARHTITVGSCALPAQVQAVSGGTPSVAGTELPRTGSNTGWALGTAGGLLAAGTLLMLGGRRRSPRPDQV